MANDWPGLEVAKFLVEENENIIRLYVHKPDNQKLSNEIIDAVSCSEVYDASLLKDEAHVEELKLLDADFIITVYWAYLLTPDVINSVKGSINFHPALLPINRGWFPHVHSIIDGSPLGVTLHRIDEGADTGPVWVQKEIDLLSTDTAKSIYDLLQREMVELFKNNWNAIKSGKLTPQAQDNSKAIYHKKNEIELLDFIDLDKETTARELINKLRARSFGDLGFAYFEDEGDRIHVNLRLSKNNKFEN